MRGRIGDEIVVDATHTGEPRREGEILDVLDNGAVLHYRVRWDDGHESVFFPSSDAHVVAVKSTKGAS
jgi:hypothetical protein